MASTKEHLNTTNRNWRLASLLVGAISLILGVVELGLAGGSGIAGVYVVSVVLVANAVICFRYASTLK